MESCILSAKSRHEDTNNTVHQPPNPPLIPTLSKYEAQDQDIHHPLQPPQTHRPHLLPRLANQNRHTSTLPPLRHLQHHHITQLKSLFPITKSFLHRSHNYTILLPRLPCTHNDSVQHQNKNRKAVAWMIRSSLWMRISQMKFQRTLRGWGDVRIRRMRCLWMI